jgi:hypothetical protein
MDKRKAVCLVLIISVGIFIFIVANYDRDRNTELNRWCEKTDKLDCVIGGRLSNTAKWHIYDITGATISIASLKFPYFRYTFSLPELSFGENQELYGSYFYKWAPDDSALLIYRTVRRCGKKDFIVIENKNGLWHQSEYISKNDNYDKCYQYQWSNDGLHFSVIEEITDLFADKLFKAGEIYPIEIFDRNANLVQRITYKIPEEDEDTFPNGLNISLSWFEKSFFLVKNNSFISPTHIIELSEDQPNVIHAKIEIDGMYRILGVSPDMNKLLLNQFVFDNQYLVVNIDHNEIEVQKEIINEQYKAGVHFPKNSDNGDYIAFMIRFKNENELGSHFNIVIWDWNTMNYTDYGEVQTLLGWDERKKGFWVIVDDKTTKDVFLKIVKPSN